MIIGLSGKKYSGKSSVADYLVSMKDFEQVSWAEPLKEVIGIELMGLTWNQVYGTEEDKETMDEFWGRTPRDIMQLVGTECCRKVIHEDFWVKIGSRRIQHFIDHDINVVLPDCRFVNEAEAIKKLGGTMVRITREGQISTDTHASETALDKYGFDYEMSAKSGDLDGLFERVDQILLLNAI